MEHPTAVILREAAFSVEEWDKHLRLNIDDEQFTYHMIFGQLGPTSWLGGWVDPEIRYCWLMKDIKNCKICDLLYYRDLMKNKYGVVGINEQRRCQDCEQMYELRYGKFLD